MRSLILSPTRSADLPSRVDGSRRRDDVQERPTPQVGDIDPQKRSLLRDVAKGVMDAPDDVGMDDVQLQRVRMELAQREAREARENLATTLGPWKSEYAPVRDDDLPPGFKVQKWTRSDMLESRPIFEIRAQVVSRGRRCDPEMRGYKTSGRYLTFEHFDLSTVMAVADLAARLHGYRMTDSMEAEILPQPARQLVTVPVAPAPSPKLLPPANEILDVAGGQRRREDHAASVLDVLEALEAMY